jgi:hypothetical protein
MRESNTITKGNGQRTNARAAAEAKAAVEQAVSDRPWLMLGAAAGAGLTVGWQSRRLLRSNSVGVLLATLGGVAVRFAADALIEWLDAQRRRRRA